jgi:hypothetical protein
MVGVSGFAFPFSNLVANLWLNSHETVYAEAIGLEQMEAGGLCKAPVSID